MTPVPNQTHSGQKFPCPPVMAQMAVQMMPGVEIATSRSTWGRTPRRRSFFSFFAGSFGSPRKACSRSASVRAA